MRLSASNLTGMRDEMASRSLLGLLLKRAGSGGENLEAVVELQKTEENDSVGNAYSLKYLLSEVHFWLPKASPICPVGAQQHCINISLCPLIYCP